MTEQVQPQFEPATGRKLLIGGFTYSKAMMQGWAEAVGGLEGVTDVDMITLVEAFNDPGRFRKMVAGALVEGHSGAGAAYAAKAAYCDVSPEPKEVKLIASAEGRKSAGRLLGGAVLLNGRQGLKATLGRKEERPIYRQAVGGKAKETARLRDVPPNWRAFRAIGRTSTIETLTVIHKASRGQTRVANVLVEDDEFGFGLSGEDIETARRVGVEVIEIGATSYDRGYGRVPIPGPPLTLDHETPVLFAKRITPIVNHERARHS